MLSIIFIRTVWGVWFLVSLFLLGHVVSNAMFCRLERRPVKVVRSLMVVVVWPLMLLSAAGRKRIKLTMKDGM